MTIGGPRGGPGYDWGPVIEEESHRMLSVFRDVIGLFSPRSRRALYVAMGLSALNALLELVGALLIVLLFRAVTDPASVLSSGWAETVRGWIGDPSDKTFLVLLALSVAVFTLLKNVANIVQTALFARTANRASADVAKELLHRYLSWSYVAFREHRSSELIRSITLSADAALKTFFFAVSGILAEALVVLMIGGMLVIADPVVAVVMGLLIGSAAYVASRRLKRSVDWYAQEAFQITEQLLFQVQQAIGAGREIRVRGRQSYFLSTYEQMRERWLKTLWRYDTALQLPRYLFETIFVGAIVVVVSVFVVRDSLGQDSVSVLGLYAYAGLRLLPSVNRIVASRSIARYYRPNVEELVIKLREQAPALIVAVDDRPAEPFDRLELRDLGYHYPGRTEAALSGVSLMVERGESIGIVGPSGAGKSTMLDILVGLVEPTEGSLLVDGVDLAHRMHEWQRQIGYVPQSPFLLAGSIRNNIAFGVEPDDVDDAALVDAVRLARLDDLVASLTDGLDTDVGESAANLSGGQRQRLAIARALYHGPEVLVFDEATSSLDYESEREVNAALESLAGTKTLLIVAHRLAAVRRCDRLVLLDRGKVSAIGSYDELLRVSPAFASMVASAT